MSDMSAWAPREVVDHRQRPAEEGKTVESSEAQASSLMAARMARPSVVVGVVSAGEAGMTGEEALAVDGHLVADRHRRLGLVDPHDVGRPVAVWAEAYGDARIQRRAARPAQVPRPRSGAVGWRRAPASPTLLP